MPLVQTDYGLIYNTNGSLCVTLRPGEGKFGGAVAVEEARENALFTLSGGYVSWLADLREGQNTDRSVGGGIVRVTRLGEHRFRAEVIQDITGASSISLTQTNFVWPANQPHVISAYIHDYYEAPGTNGAWGLGRSSNGGPHLNGRNGLGRKVHLHTPTSSDVTTRLGLRAAGSNSLVTTGSYIEWEFAQAELNASFATSFVAGTRATGGLEYPGSVLPLDEATLICWVKAHEGSPDQRRDIWAINSSVSSDDRLILGRNITGSGWGFHFRLAGGSSSELRHNVPLDFDWHMIGFRYRYNASSDRYDLALIFDGDIVATGTSANTGMLKNIYRLYSDGNRYAANCLIDELLILPYAASEQEIQDIYQKGVVHIRRPGYYAPFDNSIALQHWIDVIYDYKVDNNRIVFTEAPKAEDHVFALYELGL